MFKDITFLGRQYDKNGNGNHWWDTETIEKFTQKSQCFIDMYENYKVPELVPPLDPNDAHVSKAPLLQLTVLSQFFNSS